MQYRQEKKRTNLPKSYELALLYGKAKWRLFNTATTPCDGFAAVFAFDDVMPPADRCSICGLYFWWFRRDALAAVTTKNTKMSYRSANTKRRQRGDAEPFHATLHHLCVRCTIRHYAEPFHATLHCLYVRCTILHYAEPFHATLHRLCARCGIRHHPEPFHTTLHRLCARCAIRHCAKPFHATLNLMCVHGTIRHYAEPFYAMLHRLCTVLKMSAKLFAIELVHFTISCSNST